MEPKSLALGEKIRNFRKRAGMSQFELETEIDASPGMLSRIENNEVNPTKETLMKIIEACDLNEYDAALMFNLDLQQSINKISTISTSLNTSVDINEILNTTIKNLLSIVGLDYSSVWYWDEKKQGLRLKGLTVPEIVTKFAYKLLGFSVINNILLTTEDSRYKNNIILNTFILGKPTKTDKFFEISSGIINKTASKIFERLLGMKSALHYPIIYDGHKLGVIGFISNKSVATEGEELMYQSFVDQIAIALHNAKRYEELEQKYIELKNKYE